MFLQSPSAAELEALENCFCVESEFLLVCGANENRFERFSFGEISNRLPHLIDELRWRSVLRTKAYRLLEIDPKSHRQSSSSNVTSINFQNEQALRSMLEQKEFQDLINYASRLIENGVSITFDLMDELLVAFFGKGLCDSNEAAVLRRLCSSLFCKIVVHLPAVAHEWSKLSSLPLPLTKSSKLSSASSMKFGIYKAKTNFKTLLESIVVDDAAACLAPVIEALLYSLFADAGQCIEKSPLPSLSHFLQMFAMDSFVSVYDIKCLIHAFLCAFKAQHYQRFSCLKLLLEMFCAHFSVSSEIGKSVTDLVELIIVEIKSVFDEDDEKIASFIEHAFSMANFKAAIIQSILSKFYRLPASKSAKKEYSGAVESLIFWDLLFAPPERPKATNRKLLQQQDMTILNLYKSMLIDSVFDSRRVFLGKLNDGRLLQPSFSASEVLLMQQECSKHASSESQFSGAFAILQSKLDSELSSKTK